MRTDITPSLTAVDAYLAHLAQYQHAPGVAAEPALAALAGGPEAKQFVQAVSGQPAEVLAQVAARLATGLATLPDPFAAGLVAIQVGGLVEAGVDPVPLADALRTRLPADYAAARRFVELVETETGSERPDDVDAATLAALAERERTGAAAWAALRYSTPAAMAVWCRHRPARLAAKAVAGLAEDAVFLGEHGGYCYYIGALLTAADGTQVTIIAPEQRRGFVVELEVVRCAAHLFVLLEAALVGDGLLTGPRPDANVVAFAQGTSEGQAVGDAFAVGWHYEYWWGLEPTAYAQASGLHPAIAAMIGVEATVHDLPPFRGQPLLLMRPGRFASRMCDISFFAPLHGDLRSRVTVLRHLSPEEVDALCADLRAEAAQLG